jgi:hypothetical protein
VGQNQLPDAALFVQPYPAARPPGADQRAIAQARERAGVDPGEQRPRFVTIEH